MTSDVLLDRMALALAVIERSLPVLEDLRQEVAVWQRRQQAIAAVFVAAREVVEALECARFSHRMENRAVHNNVPECLHDCFPLVDLEDALKLYDSLGGEL